VDMTNQVRSTPGLWNKLKVLFYKPGWQPAELGGYQMALEVDKKTYRKFDVHPHIPMIRYVFVQFLLVLTFTSVFLFTQSNYAIEVKLAMAGFIMWSIAQLGILMENRRSWIPAEYVRILVSGAIIWFLFEGIITYSITGLFIIGFILWLKSASAKTQ